MSNSLQGRWPTYMSGKKLGISMLEKVDTRYAWHLYCINCWTKLRECILKLFVILKIRILQFTIIYIFKIFIVIGRLLETTITICMLLNIKICLKGQNLTCKIQYLFKTTYHLKRKSIIIKELQFPNILIKFCINPKWNQKCFCILVR